MLSTFVKKIKAVLINHIKNQIEYDTYILTLNLSKLKCKCGHHGAFHKHGTYKRQVKYIKDGEKIELIILRVKCSHCHTTHAILPPNIVPYSQIPLNIIHLIIAALERGMNKKEIIETYPDIDEYDINYVIQQYKTHWKKRLKSIYMTIKTLDLKKVINQYKRQFMQNKPTYYYAD